MTAVEFIQENTDPMVLLEHYNFREIKQYENEIRACCEIHKGNNPNAFIWNKKNNLWFCYTGENCGGGDAVELVQKMENISFVSAVSKAASILHLDIEGLEVLQTDRIKREQKAWLKKQAKTSRYKEPEKIYEIPYTAYYDNHPSFSRFDEETLKFYDAKFCKLFPSENSVLKNKLVIPLHFEHILRGAALRDTTGIFFPKWMYMPKGFKASKYLYNIDRITNLIEEGCEEIILTEGIFDVWSFHDIGLDNAAAIFGSNLSQEQYDTLMKLNVGITTCFDNDKAGQKCTLSAIKKFRNKTDLKVMELPEGKDPGDCTKDELLSAYLNRRRT